MIAYHLNKFNHIWLYLCTCLLTLGSAMTMLAADEKVPTHIRAWQLDKWTGVADTLAGVDTTYMDHPMRSQLNDYSISNITNSNIVSPVQSRVYFDRQKNVDFLFADPYAPYIITPQQVKY